MKNKLNTKNNVESRLEVLEQFGWADTLLNETEKQTVEYISVEYHDIFARLRMDVGLNKEFKVELSPKDDKAAYSQSLPLPIVAVVFWASVSW